MRRKDKLDSIHLHIGAMCKHAVFCGGWGGKVLGMLTGGLVGNTGTETSTTQVAAPTDVSTGEQATQAEANERRRRRTGFSSTVGAGNSTTGGTQRSSVLGG